MRPVEPLVTPDRWRRVTAAFHAAREREPDERGPLLDRLCGADASLRAEVESLLSAEADASRAGRGPFASDILPELSPGTIIGTYRIEQLIGAGGMGQVYRATDTRLHRAVALKLLLPELAIDSGFGVRFEREAHVLASLNHPNIAAIHGFEHADGVQALVLELVEGRTLAELLSGRSLGRDESLRIARQVASALEAAHERGIVHRDLKPANIKITPTGVVKVLDFGIAQTSASASTTPATEGATRTGLVLGTPAYMSPEQARGQAVDRRTDIWAFGCVLFEMLTGRGAFAAGTASDSLAKVIERDPDWTALPASLPDPIRRLVKRCLQKDPADRLHDIADARIEIAEAMATSGTKPSPTTEAESRLQVASGWRRALIIVAALAFLGLGSWTIWRLAKNTAPTAAPFMEFGVTFPPGVVPAFGVAVSPDGSKIAAGGFINSPQIWVHTFEPPDTRPLPGTEGGVGPFWSPDSQTIAFFRGDKLWTIPASGGPAAVLATVGQGVRSGDWSARVILFSVSGRLFRLPTSGGTPVEIHLTNVDGVPLVPCLLPDGRHFLLFTHHRGGRSTIEIGALDADRVTSIGQADAHGTFAVPDQVLFVRNATLFAQTLDLKRFVLTGDPRIVTHSVLPGFVSDFPPPISTSATGILAFEEPRGGSRGQLTWFDRAGKVLGAIESPSDGTEYLNPALSPPSGAFLVASRMDQQTGKWAIWSIDVARSAASRLTVEPGPAFDPVWSPDGRAIAYASDVNGRRGFYRQSLSGGPPEFLLDVDDAAIAVPTDWSETPEGEYLIYQRLDRARWAIWALPLSGDRKPFQVVSDEFSPYAGHLSPDGRWLAYNAAESDQFEVFIQPFRSDRPKVKVSHGGGVHPRWTKGGSELVYDAVPGGILANDILISGSDIRVGPTRTLIDRPVPNLIDGRSHYDVTRDGERLIARQIAGVQNPGIRVIVNWTSKLK